MKYGESTFDILYLLFALIGGCVLLRRAKDKMGKCMGTAALVLGCGDAFHLVPRVLNYFSEGDLTAALGVGKLITSITMTAFYLLLYPVWLGRFRMQEKRSVSATLWFLAAVRVVLCLFPQNGWLSNSGDMTWGIIRNVPFVLLGAAICCLYFRKRKEDRIFVAEDPDVIAFLSVEVHHEERDYIYLDDFSVTKTYRNRGIGSELIHTAEAYAKELRIPAVVLHVEKTNTSAMRFYERMGYTVCRDDGNRYLMVKDIVAE